MSRTLVLFASHHGQTHDIRIVMRLISGSQGRPTDTRRDYVFTDWKQVDGFAHAILAGLAPESAARSFAAVC